MRSVITDFLQDHYEVIEASSADEAIALLQSGPPMDLVLSDVVMPGTMNGFGLVQWLRQHFPLVPAILITGYYPELRSPGSELPPILRKPFSLERLLGLIVDTLNRTDDSLARP
ncbi:MAG: response regulator [Proteobacteria bacterium]|nr:response regulator [Pseudomonadota bacterium]